MQFQIDNCGACHGKERVSLRVEEVRVINAVSPKAEAERVENGVKIKVEDYLHESEAVLLDGEKGDRGDPGPGVPEGGEAGQVLRKKSGEDHDTEWSDETPDDSERVTTLDGTELAGKAIEAVGIPVYVDDPGAYPDYHIQQTGWYVFARITAPQGVTADAGTTVITGAAGFILTTGADHVDVAVRFDVAAMSKTVTVRWTAEVTDTFVFKATDLAVRNLDYRTTFYVYDLAPFTTWEFALTTDTTFAEDKYYYTETDGVYTLAEVTVGEAVPADTYYNHSKLHIEGMARNVTYQLDTPVDCPSEIVLPAIEDDGHGAWFEMRFRHTGSFSSTLLPEDEDVKIATEHTQAESKGMNMVDLHYLSVGGVKLWRFMNTHSTIPT